MRRIGLAFDRCLYNAGAIGGAVTALGAVRRSAINFDQLRIVHVGTESALDSLQISLVAIAGKLDSIGESLRHVINKPLSTFAIATADEIPGNKFSVRVHCDPCPN